MQDENDSLKITNEKDNLELSECKTRIEQLQEALLQARKEQYFALEESHYQGKLSHENRSMSAAINNKVGNSEEVLQETIELSGIHLHLSLDEESKSKGRLPSLDASMSNMMNNLDSLHTV